MGCCGSGLEGVTFYFIHLMNINRKYTEGYIYTFDIKKEMGTQPKNECGHLLFRKSGSIKKTCVNDITVETPFTGEKWDETERKFQGTTNET